MIITVVNFKDIKQLLELLGGRLDHRVAIDGCREPIKCFISAAGRQLMLPSPFKLETVDVGRFTHA
jgi:hypothetical protein